MENASKALIMAAGVLIGILMLSLMIYLFIDFGQKSKDIHDQITANQLTQFNAQFNIYSDRDDITIYEIVTVARLAHENNITNSENPEYQIKVFLKDSVSGGGTKRLDEEGNFEENYIKKYNNMKEGELEFKFKCKNVEYWETNGRIKEVIFSR